MSKNTLVKYKNNELTFDTLVRNVWNDVLTDPFFGFTRNWRPESIVEKENEYLLEIELPRIKKDDVKVEAIENDTIKVTAKNDKVSYVRLFQMDRLNANEASVKLEDGVLTITVPKTAKVLPNVKTLEIKS